MRGTLARCFPEIAGQWHPTKNAKLDPEHIAPFSKKRVWWLCNKGHEWQTAVQNRTLSGSGCHKCSGYSEQIKCEYSKDKQWKRCNNCGKMLSIDDFRTRRKSGYWLNSVCKKCEARHVLQYRTMTVEGIVAEIIRRKKSVCKKEGLSFDLTKEWVLNRLEEICWKCELTGMPMRSLKADLDEKYTGFNWNSISIDRIKHDGGYTKNNVRFVLNQVNIFRQNGPDERMYDIAEALIRNRKR